MRVAFAGPFLARPDRARRAPNARCLHPAPDPAPAKRSSSPCGPLLGARPLSWDGRAARLRALRRARSRADGAPSSGAGGSRGRPRVPGREGRAEGPGSLRADSRSPGETPEGGSRPAPRTPAGAPPAEGRHLRLLRAPQPAPRSPRAPSPATPPSPAGNPGLPSWGRPTRAGEGRPQAGWEGGASRGGDPAAPKGWRFPALRDGAPSGLAGLEGKINEPNRK